MVLRVTEGILQFFLKKKAEAVSMQQEITHTKTWKYQIRSGEEKPCEAAQMSKRERVIHWGKHMHVLLAWKCASWLLCSSDVPDTEQALLISTARSHFSTGKHLKDGRFLGISVSTCNILPEMWNNNNNDDNNNTV